MKKATYITSVTGVILILTSLLFKIYYLTGAGILLVLGTFDLVFVACPLFIAYLMRVKAPAVSILTIISFAIMVAGFAFKIQHWFGGNIIVTAGIVLFDIFIILFANNHYKQQGQGI